MTLRERIADWISGGALVWGEHRAMVAENAFSDEYEEHLKTYESNVTMVQALQSIIECETPSANATVRRMSAIAREALK